MIQFFSELFYHVIVEAMLEVNYVKMFFFLIKNDLPSVEDWKTIVKIKYCFNKYSYIIDSSLFRGMHFKKINVHKKKLEAKPFHSVLNNIISSLMMLIWPSICSFDSAILLRVWCKACISLLRPSPSVDNLFSTINTYEKNWKSIEYIIKYNYIRLLIVNVK